MHQGKFDEDGYLVCFIFIERNFAFLRKCQVVLMRFFRVLRRLLFWVFGGGLRFFFAQLSGLVLALFTLFSARDSRLYFFASDFSLHFMCSVLGGGYPYRSCRGWLLRPHPTTTVSSLAIFSTGWGLRVMAVLCEVQCLPNCQLGESSMIDSTSGLVVAHIVYYAIFGFYY